MVYNRMGLGVRDRADCRPPNMVDTRVVNMIVGLSGIVLDVDSVEEPVGITACRSDSESELEGVEPKK